MIERHNLPQIPQEQYRKFVEFLQDNGIVVKAKDIPTDNLHPIQSHVNRGKVEYFKENPELTDTPIFVSEDGSVLDGHHRWVARSESKLPKTRCIEVECGIDELIKLGHEFEGSERRSVYESMANDQNICDSSLGYLVKKTLKWT